MSLAKYLAQNVEKFGPDVLEAIKAHKNLAAGAALGAGVVGAGAVAKPYVEDYAADQAFRHIENQAKEAIGDTVDYADKHPYMAAGLLGAAGTAGATLGGQDYAKMFDAVSPIKISQFLSGGQEAPRRRRNR